MTEKAVLSDTSILNYIKHGLLIETPINGIQLQPNSVDLTLGNTYKFLLPNAMDVSTRQAGDISFVTGYKEFIDPRKEIKYESHIFDEFIEIPPGGFMLLASREILNIPNGILSFVQGRSSIARLGIQTEQAGLIDAGFRGTITFEVFNETKYPVRLYEGMRIAQVYFFRAEEARQLYGKEHGSKYSDQIDATGSRIYLDKELNK